jgi:hypothetical protein
MGEGEAGIERERGGVEGVGVDDGLEGRIKAIL